MGLELSSDEDHELPGGACIITLAGFADDADEARDAAGDDARDADGDEARDAAGDDDLLRLPNKGAPFSGSFRVFLLKNALTRPNIPFLGEPLGAGTAARLCTDAAEEDDDAREAGLETTGCKILIPPGATTLPLRDDANEALSLPNNRSPAALATGSF